MAIHEMRTFHPTLRHLAEINPAKVAFDYDCPADTLYVYLDGQPRPSIEYVLDDHFLLSLDPVTEEVVALQFDGFLAHVIYELPAFLGVANVIGLTSEEVERVQERIGPEARTRVALEAFLGHVEPLRAVE